MLGAILLLLAMLPAAGIACFSICLAVANSMANDNNDPYRTTPLMVGLAAGVVGGAVVCGLMLWWGIALTRQRAERPRTWIKSDGTRFDAFFISCDDNSVTLRHADGSQSQLPLHQLCDRDREWLALQRERTNPRIGS